MKRFFPVLVALTFALSGCGEKPTEKTRVKPEAIRDAISGNFQGWKDGSLPETYWPETIKTLTPIRIYSDRANRVIALSQQNGFESGYYVYISISSYLPSNDQEWSFLEIGENIWAYTRKLGEQNAAEQPATRL